MKKYLGLMSIETITTETRTVWIGTGENQKIETTTVRKKTYRKEATDSNGAKMEKSRRNGGKTKHQDKAGSKIKNAFIKGGKRAFWIIMITIVLMFIFEKIRFGQVMSKGLAIIMPPLCGVIRHIDKLIRDDCVGTGVSDFIKDHGDSFIVEILKFICRAGGLICKKILGFFGIKDFKWKFRYGIIAFAVLLAASTGSENHVCAKIAENCLIFLQSAECGCAGSGNEYGI